MINQIQLDQMIESHVSQFRLRLNEVLSVDVARMQKHEDDAKDGATKAEARTAEVERRKSEAERKEAELRATFKDLGEKIAARQTQLNDLDREYERREPEVAELRREYDKYLRVKKALEESEAS
jgi:hypothetical protein